MSLIEKLKKFKRESGKVFFTTPSHIKGDLPIIEARELLGDEYLRADISEITGFDDYSNPETVIKEAENLTGGVYQTKKTFYLVNGSSSGVIASMVGILNKFDKVLVDRSCHKCVYNGLVLSNSIPVWIKRNYNPEWGIYTDINLNEIEEKIQTTKDLKAMVITNPTYEGYCIDIEPIAKLCEENDIKLIVDEAHGALWNFSEQLPNSSLLCGADIAVQSLHKTAGAINPSALLHISYGSNVDECKIKQALNLINTTSPSYPLLANIEACINYLDSEQGYKKIYLLLQEIASFKNSLKKCIDIQFFETQDPTKILFKLNSFSGETVAQILENEFNIEVELANKKSVLLLTGIGTPLRNLQKLKRALIKISKIYKDKYKYENEDFVEIEPKTLIYPFQAFKSEYEEVELYNAIGRICYELVLKSPPSIPLIIPGEIIKKEHLKFIEKDTIKVIKY